MTDERFMRLAAAAARKGAGRTSPNPVVGAVIVKGGKVVARGYHKKAGLPHAEIEAMRAAEGASLNGATLYVTLEPCCHAGKRTPPCTEAVIASGIRNVVVGMLDPNPQVSGKGVKALVKHGIAVRTGCLYDECRALNLPYIKYIVTHTPYVTVKLAATLDGRIAAANGESRWITGEASRDFVHRLRSMNDAVITGITTVIKDDPLLTSRGGKDPLRVVLDAGLLMPLSSRMLRDGGMRPLIFTSRDAPDVKIKKLRALGAEVVSVRSARAGISLPAVLKELGSRCITSVLVESGGTLAASFIRAGLADKLLYFVAPMVLGSEGVASVGALGIKSLKKARRIKNVRMKRFGDDILIEGEFFSEL